MKQAKQQEGYISKAILRNCRVAPRKARLVIDLIRGKQVEVALDLLTCCDKKTAPIFRKLLLSAVANASQQSDVDVDELVVQSAWVDEGKTIKRFPPRAQGRAAPIRKRNSHVTIILDETAR